MLVLDPAREPGAAAARARPARSRYVAWRRRLVLVGRPASSAAVVPLAAWALHNGIRYDDATVARGGRAWVPFLSVFTANRTIAPENGDGVASARAS